MGKLVVLMVTAFIDMVGLLMVLPLLPFYAQRLGAGGLVVGMLVSSFSVAQLLSAPVWGRMSDRYGRRPALLVGLTASAIAYIVFAYADSLWLLFASRIVQGAGGGTVGVIQAYVTDALPPNQRARGLGWLSAATNAGVALGPVLGSTAAVFAREGPGLLAAALCVVNIIFASKFLSESRDMKEAAAQPRKKGRSREAIAEVITHSREPASRLIWIYAIGMGAFHGVNAVLALFLARRFGVTEHTIGFFFMYIGVIAVLTRALVLGKAVDRLGEARLSRIGITLLALGLATLPFTPMVAGAGTAARSAGGILAAAASGVLPYLPLAIAVALIPLGTAFTFPCVTSLLSRAIPSHERGLYMGVQQTFGGVARVIFPILGGLAFDRVVELPFVVGGTLVFATMFLVVGVDRSSGLDVPAAIDVPGAVDVPAPRVDLPASTVDSRPSAEKP